VKERPAGDGQPARVGLAGVAFDTARADRDRFAGDANGLNGLG